VFKLKLETTGSSLVLILLFELRLGPLAAGIGFAVGTGGFMVFLLLPKLPLIRDGLTLLKTPLFLEPRVDITFSFLVGYFTALFISLTTVVVGLSCVIGVFI